MRRLRQLEEENFRLKRLVADLTLDKSILQEVIKKDLKPMRRGDLTQWIQHTYDVGLECAHELVRLSQTVWYYTSKQDQREGWYINVKWAHHLYYLEGLKVRMRRHRKKRLSLHPEIPATAGAVNDLWIMVRQGFPLVILSMINSSMD